MVPWDYQVEENTKMINTATAHKMTRSRTCYVPDNLKKSALGREHNQKRNITDAEMIEFRKKMQIKDYLVEEQLKKMPTQISIMSLMMILEAHRNALGGVLME
ncbi:hypothetical protein HAX54_049768 [Datura stramonium]|uniref:Uncharacterized protein n=1 Tax=Datura stramonium TaxID=4076 RepID=A0ABS8WNH9_DATST|nr:hypothetical protein [Datura stramonium]